MGVACEEAQSVFSSKEDKMRPCKVRLCVAAGLALAATLPLMAASTQAHKSRKSNSVPNQGESVTFNMIVSGGAAACLPGATATVTITPAGPVEIMDVNVSNLPANNEFDLFVLQLPRAPFGVAWYQGDIETDAYGNGSGEFVGRFSIETFAVAQGSGAAPVVHDGPPFPDADTNPPFEPIHTFHLGLWFGSPDEAAAAGCPNTVTRFNGNHTAGIQVLNTGNFPDLQGPLLQVQ
jgi:hypothetical protein